MSDQSTNDVPANGKPHSHESYALFRNKDYVLFLIGRLISTLGQQMFAMAVGWEIYDRTGSSGYGALALACVGLTQFIPMILFTLPAGHVADNYNRKSVIALMTTIVAVANICLCFISLQRWSIAGIYVCLFVVGSARTFLWAASASFLPQLVERKNFSRAVTWNVGAFQIASIVGPLSGGFVIAHNTHHAAPVYAINALAALIFCWLLSRIKTHHVVAVKEKMSTKTLLNGFRFVFSTRIILGIITLDMFAVLFGGAVALLPVYAKEILLVGPVGLGFLQAALPFGSICCGFLLAHSPPMKMAGPSMLWAVAAFGVATIAFGLSHWFWFSLLMLFTCGAVDNVSVVVRQTLVQMLTPDEKRGRVSAVNNLFIGTSNELGEFESGSVATLAQKFLGSTVAAGAMISAVSGGIGTILVVAVVAWLWPEIRKLGRLDAAGEK